MRPLPAAGHHPIRLILERGISGATPIATAIE
jgi:hypothetical protein